MSGANQGSAMNVSAHLKLTAALEPAPEGGYTSTFEELPELFSEGESAAEALANLFDALRLVGDYLTQCPGKISGSCRALRSALIPVLVIVLLSCCIGRATPDHVVEVEEVLLGSNAKSFVILRTEHDNMASHYRSQVRRCLDEYQKVQPGEKEQFARQQPAKSTVLLDVTYTLDPGNQDPRQVPAEKVNARDDSVSLTKVLSDFPKQPGRWDAEKFRLLTTDQRAGVLIGKRSIVWGGHVTEKLYGERNSQRDWVLEELSEDEDTIYMRVASPAGAERQRRYLSLPVHATRQARYRLGMHPVYLSAGTFITEKQAVDKAVELAGDRTRLNVPGPAPEVWTMRMPTDKIEYVVVLCPLEEADTAEKFAHLEGRLSVSLAPQNSRDFQERIPLPPPKPDKVKEPAKTE